MFPFNDYIVWHNPGFLSLAVPYDRTRDFFFSGHTTILVLIILEMMAIRWYSIAILAYLTLIYIANMLIISRIHYTIDIIAAPIYCILIQKIVVWNLKYIDIGASFPFYIGLIIRDKYFSSDKK